MLHVRKARLQLTPAPGCEFRSERSVLQLVNHDRWDRQITTRGFVDAYDYCGIALQVMNHDVRVEECQSRLSRGTSSP